ncbi:MAG: hypothetical protein NTU41_12560 [Chloroflexi bacterium]|nr:hypothetical protein [Chloroflexota bacterium]
MHTSSSRSRVGPEKRKQWLKRLEEDDETPPQIAQAEGFDVRTVRKQLELARQDREVREARTMVLRQALEKHYGDLATFTEGLEGVLATPLITVLTLPLGERSSRLWSALREHLPRSPLWKNMDKWEALRIELARLGEQGRTRLLRDLESWSTFDLQSSTWEKAGLYLPGLSNAIDDRVRGLLEGKSFPIKDFHTAIRQDGLVAVDYFKGWYCATVPPDRVDEVKQLITGLMQRVDALPELASMEEIRSELKTVAATANEELATIRLRRVVPGRCKYCPF